MGLFGNPRNNKAKWASVVTEDKQPGMNYDVAFLEAVTALYIQQHTRILYDSIRIVLTSKNEKTRKDRYALAQKKFNALVKVKKYADKEQKKMIIQALDDFLKMEDMYKQPGKYDGKGFDRKQLTEDFWNVYAQMEMIDIFSGAKK